MQNTIRFVMVLHDHQPVGNFDHVFEQAYQDSYKPFLDVFERYPTLKMGLHTSGPLMEWLDVRHGEYLDRLAALVAAGRVEIIGGAFYEPILAMIPSRDRIGQIRSFTQWLENRLGAQVQGMWMPERVWEQNFTSDLVAAGIRYTMLDDSHFKNGGLSTEQLYGYYLTEDEGNLLAVFPDSEPLRYLIPFGGAHQVIEHLSELAHKHTNAIAVFGDDGEKFGAWPETKRSVYEEGWLTRFFDLLVENRSWIQCVTPAEALESTPPVGKVYLPEGSYREMTEWVLPADQLCEFTHVRREFENDPRWPKLARFVRGGFWRNFKVKYPETNEMYARMMQVSKRLQKLTEAGVAGELIDHARSCLYRGQCNCSYWHGAFGGTYLPHLRNAVYQQLIAADNLLDRASGRGGSFVEATADDFNFDGRQEILLANNRLSALIAPSRGGQIYELDVRSICHNLLATMTRRPEAYHRSILGGANGRSDIAGVADRVIFKQPGLDQHLQYDSWPRKSLLDHFYDPGVGLVAVSHGDAAERGDFLNRPYEARLRRNPDRIQAQLSAQGVACGEPVRVTKAVTIEENSATLEITYLLEGLRADRPMRFAVELNFAGLPSGADDRYFHGADGQRLGQLGARLDLAEVREIGLVDEWLGIDCGLSISRPSGIWTYPIETVSQSEGGFELVHQSVAVEPHWLLEPDAEGRWSVSMTLTLDTSRAEQRQERHAAAAAH